MKVEITNDGAIGLTQKWVVKYPNVEGKNEIEKQSFQTKKEAKIVAHKAVDLIFAHLT